MPKVLENSKEKYSQYGGMISVKSKRRAIILVASGIDTFSKINLDQIYRIRKNKTGGIFSDEDDIYVEVSKLNLPTFTKEG